MKSSFTIVLASDHAGFVLKNSVKEWLVGEGFTVLDCGAEGYDALDDFPDFISKAAQMVSAKPAKSRGIIFGGSGQGEAMVANRFPHVRATVFYGGPEEIITLSREHNDANVLSIGARFIDEDTTKRVIWKWLHEPTSLDEKHHRRNQKIDSVTKKK